MTFTTELANKLVENYDKLARRYKIYAYGEEVNSISKITYYIESDENARDTLRAAFTLLNTVISLYNPETAYEDITKIVTTTMEGILFGEIKSIQQLKTKLTEIGCPVAVVPIMEMGNFKVGNFCNKFGTKYFVIQHTSEKGADIFTVDILDDKAKLHSTPELSPFLELATSGNMEQLLIGVVTEALNEYKQEQAQDSEHEVVKVEETTPDTKSDEAIEPSEQIEVKKKAFRDGFNYCCKGLKYLTQGNLESAIDYFTNAIKCNNNYAPAYFFRARSYWRKEKIDCAIEDMIRALNIAEQDSSAFTMLEDLHLADVYFDLGLLYSEINELEKAAEYYQKAQPLLKELSVFSSKRKSDYQKLKMLIMSNYARIQKKVARQVIKQVIKLSKKTIQVAKKLTKQVIKLAKKVIKLFKKQVTALYANIIKHLEDSKET
jgi:tetratricopeptide (TPR) repeat protein